MEALFEKIRPTLYRSETNFPVIQNRLQRYGEPKAWFKYYHGPNQWVQRFYMEEHAFLFDQIIVVACLYNSGKLALRSYRLDEISRIERLYDFADKTEQSLVLTAVEITFKRTRDKKHPDMLSFARPLPEEDGDPDGFEVFMDMLD
jgi:hypothetical protein